MDKIKFIDTCFDDAILKII